MFGRHLSSQCYGKLVFATQSLFMMRIRMSVMIRPGSIAAFCDNLTNSHTVTDFNNTINPLVPGVSRLQRDYTVRPRTIGITAILRR